MTVFRGYYDLGCVCLWFLSMCNRYLDAVAFSCEIEIKHFHKMTQMANTQDLPWLELAEATFFLVYVISHPFHSMLSGAPIIITVIHYVLLCAEDGISAPSP